ncbi:MAG: isopentenyl phosphate kinase [Anaerolineae bacterium]
MDELIFFKLGGSLITDKSVPLTARADTIRRLANEIAAARAQNPQLRILIGHGSGSFGHPVAHRYQVHRGNLGDWYGYAATSAVVQQLDTVVINILLQAGIPAVPVQPSASARCHNGQLQYLQDDVMRALIDHHAVPVVYGDVSVDDVLGCTIISTEQIFSYLVSRLQPTRIILAGKVNGVFSSDPLVDSQAALIQILNTETFTRLGSSLGGAASIDVTGGMASKVRLMLRLAQDNPGLVIRIVSGEEPNLVGRLLVDPTFEPGTLLVN